MSLTPEQPPTPNSESYDDLEYAELVENPEDALETKSSGKDKLVAHVQNHRTRLDHLTRELDGSKKRITQLTTDLQRIGTQLQTQLKTEIHTNASRASEHTAGLRTTRLELETKIEQVDRRNDERSQSLFAKIAELEEFVRREDGIRSQLISFYDYLVFEEANALRSESSSLDVSFFARTNQRLLGVLASLGIEAIEERPPVYDESLHAEWIEPIVIEETSEPRQHNRITDWIRTGFYLVSRSPELNRVCYRTAQVRIMRMHNGPSS